VRLGEAFGLSCSASTAGSLATPARPSPLNPVPGSDAVVPVPPMMRPVTGSMIGAVALS
jgi:hypothetical protein